MVDHADESDARTDSPSDARRRAFDSDASDASSTDAMGPAESEASAGSTPPDQPTGQADPSTVPTPAREPWSWRQIFGMILCVAAAVCAITLFWQEEGLTAWIMRAVTVVLAWGGVWLLIGQWGMVRSMGLVVLGCLLGGVALAIEWEALSWLLFGAAAGALFHWGYGRGKRGFWFTTAMMFLAYGGLTVFGLLRMGDKGLLTVIVQGLLSIFIGWWLTRDRSRKDDHQRDRALYWIGTILLFFGRVLLPYLALTMVVLFHTN